MDQIIRQVGLKILNIYQHWSHITKLGGKVRGV